MIWEPAYQKDDPIGSYQDALTVGGVAWDLYEGANGARALPDYNAATTTGAPAPPRSIRSQGTP